MPLSTSQRQRLSRKAADNSLEVENLLRAAVAGDASDALLLRALKIKHKWSYSGRAQGGGRVPPFGHWADAVCCFLEKGYKGLVRMAQESPKAVYFCVSVLEELRTPEAVDAVLAIAGPKIGKSADDVERAEQAATGLNSLLFIKKGGSPLGITPAAERRVRGFLHRLLSLKLTEKQQYSAVCALRWVGDAESVALLQSLPPFRGAFRGLENEAIRRIKERTRGLQRSADGIKCRSQLNSLRTDIHYKLRSYRGHSRLLRLQITRRVQER